MLLSVYRQKAEIRKFSLLLPFKEQICTEMKVLEVTKNYFLLLSTKLKTTL